MWLLQGRIQGCVDWVASHPPSEKPTIKIYYEKKRKYMHRSQIVWGPTVSATLTPPPSPIKKIPDPRLDFVSVLAFEPHYHYLKLKYTQRTLFWIILKSLKWYYDQKIISFFSSDFGSVFAKHATGKILSFVFYPKAVYFEYKFWISRSAITRVQSWPIGHQRVGSRENDVIYSLA